MTDKKTLELQIKLVAKQAADQLSKFSAQLKKIAEGGKLSEDEIKKMSDSMSEAGKKAAGSFDQAGVSLSDLKSKVLQLGEVTGALALDKKIISAGNAALEASDSFQESKDNFSIMLHDAQLGEGVFNELQKFNKWTPFEMDDTAKATNMLLASKVQLKDLTTYLTRFGDIAQGNSEKFQSFIRAFSKGAAKGKADMEVLNVFTDQGVQILDQLGKQLGVSTEEIVKMSSEGKISFQDLDQAIAAMAAEGGLYYNSMATASQRLGAKQDSLRDSVKSLMASLGDLLAPAIKTVVEWFDNLVNAINESPFLKGLIVGAITSVVVLINTKMIMALVGMIAKIWAAFAAQMSLNTAMSVANPALIAVTVAAGAAAAGFVAYASSQKQAAAATSDLALEQRKLDETFASGTVNQIPTQYVEKLQQAEEDRKRNEAQRKQASEKWWQNQLAYSREVLQYRDKLYNQVEKTDAQKKAELEEQLEFAKSLKTLKTYNEDHSISGFNQEKTDAIIKDLEKRIADLGSIGTEWQDKMLDNVGHVGKEQANAIEKLQEKAKLKLGENYATEASYKAELNSLDLYYEDKLQEAKRKDLDEWAKGYEKILDDLKYKQLEAIKNKDLGGTVSTTFAKSALEATGDTEVGQVFQGAASGGALGALASVINAFVQAVASAIGELEHGQEVLNFISTIVDGIFEVIGPLVDDALKPAAIFLRKLGETLGKMIRPLAAIAALIAQAEPILQVVTTLLQLIGDVFQGIFDMLQPIFVGLANGYNWFVDLLGNIGIKLNKISLSMGETEKGVEAINTIQNEMIQKKYQRMQSNLQELLDSQMEALKSQYELGLISRDEYEKQAEKYASKTDEESLKIQKEMDKKLQKIADNTHAALTEEQLSQITEAAQSSQPPQQTPVQSVVSNVVKDVDDLATGGAVQAASKGNWGEAAADVGLNIATGGLFGLGKKVGSWFGWWDVGSTDIPEDQVGMVHKGETIIPKTFAEGIRSGELALVGRNGRSAGESSPVYVTVNVGGSVLSERKLVDAVYEGISSGIRANRLDPLPGGLS